MVFEISSVVVAIVMIFVNALLLMFSTKIFKLRDTSYMTALKIAAIIGVVTLVFIIAGGYVSQSFANVLGILSFVLVSILLAMWLVKTQYGLDWKKASMVWLIWFVFLIIVGIVIAMIFAAILVAIGISTAAV